VVDYKFFCGGARLNVIVGITEEPRTRYVTCASIWLRVPVSSGVTEIYFVRSRQMISTSHLPMPYCSGPQQGSHRGIYEGSKTFVLWLSDEIRLLAMDLPLPDSALMLVVSNYIQILVLIHSASSSQTPTPTRVAVNTAVCINRCA